MGFQSSSAPSNCVINRDPALDLHIRDCTGCVGASVCTDLGLHSVFSQMKCNIFSIKRWECSEIGVIIRSHVTPGVSSPSAGLCRLQAGAGGAAVNISRSGQASHKPPIQLDDMGSSGSQQPSPSDPIIASTQIHSFLAGRPL